MGIDTVSLLFWSYFGIPSAVGVMGLSAFPLLLLIPKAFVLVTENCLLLDGVLEVISFSVIAAAFFYACV